MLVTTTPSIEGKRITKYLGIVTGEAILGANVFKDVFAGLRDIAIIREQVAAASSRYCAMNTLQNLIHIHFKDEERFREPEDAKSHAVRRAMRETTRRAASGSASPTRSASASPARSRATRRSPA